MHQIDGARSVPTMPLARAAGTPGFFSPGIPEAGQKATAVTYDFMNALMMEVIHPIQQAGLTLDKSDNTQLYQAIVQIASQVSGAEIAKVEYFARRSAPDRYLKCNGKTIGSASSGATARANADTLPLFRILWADFENFVLPIQDSEGVLSVRGATADDDFGAGKRLPLMEIRAEHIRAWDDGRGVDADRAFGSWQDQLERSHYHGTGTFKSESDDNWWGILRNWTNPVALAVRWCAGESNRINSTEPGAAGGTYLTGTTDAILTGAAENRVRNIALSAFIRFK